MDLLGYFACILLIFPIASLIAGTLVYPKLKCWTPPFAIALWLGLSVGLTLFLMRSPT